MIVWYQHLSLRILVPLPGQLLLSSGISFIYSEQLGGRIRQLMEDRERIWTDESLAEELTLLDEPVSRRYVAHVRDRFGLSPGRGRRLKRKPGTPPVCRGVPGHSMQSRFDRYLPAPGSTSSRAGMG